MARTEAKRDSLEPRYDPVVVHYKATELIHQPNEGFKAILLQIPAVREATGAFFWELGGKIRIHLDSSAELDLNWEPGGVGKRTVLDVGINRTEGFNLAFITAVDPTPGADTEEKSSFLFAGYEENHAIEPSIEDTPTAFEKIEELRETLKTYIPSEE